MTERRGRIRALEVTLLGDGSEPIARGIVSIDDAEGAPPVICFDGETFLRIPGVALYRKTRVMHAASTGGSFEVIKR